MTDNTTSGAYSELQKRVTQKTEETQQLQEDSFKNAEGGAINPPFDPVKMAQLLEVNTTHAKAVFAKGRNVAGYGLDLVPHPSVEEPNESEREPAEDFWFSGESKWQVGPEQSERATSADVLEMMWDDYEGIGWLAGEILTTTDGTPMGLAYVPAMTIRRRKDERGYVQVVGQKTTFYGVAGDRDGENPVFVDKETGEVGPSVENPANELIFKRNHSPLYTHYGAPDIAPALKDLEGDDAARDFNIDFFENNAVPRMAIIVEGGELTEGAREDIHQLLHGMREEDHRTVILEVEKLLEDSDAINFDGDSDDVRIRVEPLTVGLDEDASFRDYRTDNEHEILKAHEVPPVEAGQIKSGSFSTDAEAQRRGFIETVIQPKQEAFAQLLYETIHSALDVSDYTVQFKTRGVDTRLSDAQVAKERITAAQGTMTVNEARDELGIEPLEGPIGEMLLAELAGMGRPMGGGGIGAAVEELVDDRVDNARDALRSDIETELRIQRPATGDD